MGAIADQRFVVTPEAREAMQQHGFADPVALALTIDFDIGAFNAIAEVIAAVHRHLSEVVVTMDDLFPSGWRGGSGQRWVRCRMTFTDWLRWLAQLELLYLQWEIVIIDIIFEMSGFMCELVQYVLKLLTKISVVDKVREEFAGKQVEPILSIILAGLFRTSAALITKIGVIIELVTFLVALIEPFLDRLLDRAREGLNDLRRRIGGCLPAPLPDLPDEPIPHPFPLSL